MTDTQKLLEGLRLHDLIRVKFLDHSITDTNFEGPIRCEAIGEVVGIADDYVTLRYWIAYGAPDNDEFIHLVKSTITDFAVLEEKEKGRESDQSNYILVPAGTKLI